MWYLKKIWNKILRQIFSNFYILEMMQQEQYITENNTPGGSILKTQWLERKTNKNIPGIF